MNVVVKNLGTIFLKSKCNKAPFKNGVSIGYAHLGQFCKRLRARWARGRGGPGGKVGQGAGWARGRGRQGEMSV